MSYARTLNLLSASALIGFVICAVARIAFAIWQRNDDELKKHTDEIEEDRRR